MKCYTATDIGKHREENQDYVHTGRLEGGAWVAILCDGMGGANAGGVASKMTADFIAERVARGFRPDISRNSLRNLLITSVTAANSLVFDRAHMSPEFDGMGTTCVACVVHDERAYIINVGDSRAYHIFGDNMQQITKDHTYVRGLVDRGIITERESYTHPDRHKIMRAVGAELHITPDYFEVDLQADSILLLCSDGLYMSCLPRELAEIAAVPPISTACNRLVDFALRKDTGDNITVVLMG
jgi:protein phosphatase